MFAIDSKWNRRVVARDAINSANADEATRTDGDYLDDDTEPNDGGTAEWVVSPPLTS